MPEKGSTLKSDSDPEIVTITVKAMKLSNKHYLSIVDGPKELEALLHKHVTFEQARREAQRVLGTHGVDCIRVLNDPANEEQTTTYGTCGRDSELLW
jgi:hypothetical protein